LLLVGADQQGRGESLKALLLSDVCSALKPEAVANGAALTERLVPYHSLEIDRHPIFFSADHGQAHLTGVEQRAFTPPLVFGKGMDVRIVPEAAYLESLFTEALD
jgi:hypothetical protein